MTDTVKDMFTQIETGVVAYIKTKLPKLREVDIHDDELMVIAGPAIAARIMECSFSRLTMSKFKAVATLGVVLALKNVRSDDNRRQAAYPFTLGIICYMADRVIPDLATTPFIPTSCKEMTGKDAAIAGIMIVEMLFKTSFNIAFTAEEAERLLELANSYFLPPDAAEAAIEDVVVVAEEETPSDPSD